MGAGGPRASSTPGLHGPAEAMGSGEDVFVGRSEQEDEQGLRTVARELGGVHLRGDDKAHGETIGPLMRLFRRFLIAGCNDIGPVNLTLWHAALAGVHHLRVWVC